MPTLDNIKHEVCRLAVRIDASKELLPTYGRTEDFARPHIESDQRGFHYVVVERGQELSRKTTDAQDELLFWIFSDVTFTLAADYEAAHRVGGQDSRRLLFRKQIELLSLLSPSWGERESQRHNDILKEHPYDDLASSRVDFYEELKNQGQSGDSAWLTACKRYPLPITK